jgi:hypothetical protein
MNYVIYETGSTYYMAGMKSGGYKSKGAATAALNRAAKKTNLELAGANYFDKFYARTRSYDGAIKATMIRFPEFTRYNVPTNSFIANRELIVKANYSITDAADFHNNIEKTVERINMMSRKPYMERVNTP